MGKFEQAEGGTLFLDEIGDMPPEAQTRLLRVLQEGEYTSVGGRTAIKTNVRVIAATHRDLGQLIRQGLFREDLYYRLNVVPIRMPPLRERRDDIPELVRHFLSRSSEEGLPWKMVDEPALNRLQAYGWPGNVRELENLVRRLAALYSQDTIGVEVIEAELSVAEPAPSSNLPLVSSRSAVEAHLEKYFGTYGSELPPPGLHARILQEVERPLIALSLTATRGNQVKTADLLGLNRNTLRKKIKELNIPISKTPK